MIDLIKIQDDEDRTTLLEQYKILVESINKINDVRENLNNWWTGINVALISVMAYFRSAEGLGCTQKQLFLWTIIVLGFVLCCSWLSSIFTIKKSIDIRNNMLFEFEKHLPAKIFTIAILEMGRKKNKGSLSLKEAIVPALFLTGYAFFLFMLYCYPQLSVSF